MYHGEVRNHALCGLEEDRIAEPRGGAVLVNAPHTTTIADTLAGVGDSLAGLAVGAGVDLDVAVQAVAVAARVVLLHGLSRGVRVAGVYLPLTPIM
jgi:hypothetical protein